MFQYEIQYVQYLYCVLIESSGGEKESSKKTRSSQKRDSKKKSTKEGDGEVKKSNKKLKMTVTPTTDKGQEEMKEMQLKTTHSTNNSNQVVTSITVKTGRGGGGKEGRQPVELPNIAIIDVTDSEGEEDIDGAGKRKNIATPTSQGSFDVENIFGKYY